MSGGIKELGAQARLRRLSEVHEPRAGTAYAYLLPELWASPRHATVPLEVRSEQLLVIAAHYCHEVRTWSPGEAVDPPPFVRRGRVVQRGALREVSAADAQPATPAQSRRSVGQKTPAVRILVRRL